MGKDIGRAPNLRQLLGFALQTTLPEFKCCQYFHCLGGADSRYLGELSDVDLGQMAQVVSAKVQNFAGKAQR
jgi:hypothetical protein